LRKNSRASCSLSVLWILTYGFPGHPSIIQNHRPPRICIRKRSILRSPNLIELLLGTSRISPFSHTVPCKKSVHPPC
jgi:hypothetical protein